MKKVRIIIIIVFIGFFVLISGASLIIKDREFSPNENRYLAETPELSWDNILSGKFQDGLEDYLRDQVCFRDGWITVKTGIQKACGDTDIGGAYVGKDGYDFEKITPEDVKYVLSSHYQGTLYDPYGSSQSDQKGAFRSIGINRNDFMALIQMRPDQP